MNTSPQSFTASAIARALGKKRQAVQRALDSVAPSGNVIVSGNVAAAWEIAALPSWLRSELMDTARARGCTVEELFSVPVRAWEPPLQISVIRAGFIARALKLRDALALPIERSAALHNAELTAIGLREFSRVFGYSISAKQWNRLFDRTVLRDRGFDRWQRVELYLDDAAFQKPIAKIAVIAKRFDHSALNDYLAHLENKERPTTDDRAHLFNAAFRHLETVLPTCATRPDQIAAKASVIAFLFSAAPGLSKSLAGLRRTFEIKLNEWRAADRSIDALRDERALKSGYFRTPDFTEDNKKVLVEAGKLHGNESMAYRRMRKRGELSKELTNYYTFNIRKNKSGMPKRMRKAITPKVNAAIAHFKGEREARLLGPAIPRTWNDVLPGDYISGDDVTWNHQCSVSNDQGGVDIITRCECILLNDLRTGFPFDTQLIAGHYNGRHIVSGLARVHDSIGLARKGGYWENGIWSSRWMPGVKPSIAAHFRDTETPLREWGFDLGSLSDFEQRHAISPRGKPIEGIFRVLQSMMVDQPGYVGRNERLDKLKPMQDFIARCRRGTEDPRSEGIMPMDHWLQKITEILAEWADEPQNGKMLPGVSPREMWEDGLAKRPLRKLPPELRYTLATNKRHIKRIPDKGIVLRDVPRYVYCSDELRVWQMQGREILAHYNVDVPELLTVSNMDRTEFLIVKGIGLPAMTAPRDQLREANQQIRGWHRPAKVLFAQITQKVNTIHRDAPADAAETLLGEFHNAHVEAHQAEKAERTRKLRRIQKASALGEASVGTHVRNPDRVIEGIERAQHFRERISKKEQAQ